MTPSQFNQPKQWTHTEVELMYEQHELLSVTDLARQLKRSIEDVQAMLLMFGLNSKRGTKPRERKTSTRFKRGKLWTEEEDNYLRENWCWQNTKTMALTLNRSVASVANRGASLKLTKTKDQIIAANLNEKIYWTPDEVRYLLDNWYSKPVSQIARHLRKNLPAVLKKGYKLGLKKSEDDLIRPGQWSEEDEKYLIENQASKSSSQLASALGRSVYSVRRKKFISKQATSPLNRGNLWTAQEDQFILNNWPAKTKLEIATQLGRSVTAITVRLLAITSTNQSENSKRQGGPWTSEEIEYLKNNIATRTNHEIANGLNRYVSSIRQKIKSLGLTRTKEEFKKLLNSPQRLSDAVILGYLDQSRASHEIYLQHPSVIQLKRLTIALNRKINNQ